MEVYVSSVANPHTFFVQILTSMSLRLDEVVKSMSQYYVTERQVRKPITVLQQRKNGEYVTVLCRRKTGEKTYHNTTTKKNDEYVTVLRHRKIGEYITVPRHADFYDKKNLVSLLQGRRKIIEYIAVPRHGNTGERTLRIMLL